MHVTFSRVFTKQREKAPEKIRKALDKRLDLFINSPNNPILNNHTLTGEYRGFRSINITGDWRAVFAEIDSKTAYFEMLGTHSQLYK